ncbi:repair protein Rad1/Rec1/Rad17-domain-containing protein [Scheffersomyces coipomensis]|uniref:repair protein Rad1/Rec1/Rad17-domain-containing protein n=1 Tax=Scheffersomyces coipomensis TaxID=1788519 RepID=UPI00315D3E9C
MSQLFVASSQEQGSQDHIEDEDRLYQDPTSPTIPNDNNIALNNHHRDLSSQLNDLDHNNTQSSFINPRSHTFKASTTQISHLAEVLSSITTINSQALLIISPKGITIYTEYNHVCNVQLNIDPTLFTQYNFVINDNLNNDDEDDESSENPDLRLGVDINLISDSFNSVASSLIKPKSFNKSGTSNYNNVQFDHNQNNNSGNSLNNIPLAENVTCYITYNGHGEPLIIEFEDNVMSEKLEFLTFQLDITYPYDFINNDSQSQDDIDQDYRSDFLVINHNELQFELMLKSDVFSNLLQDLQQINTVDLYIHISNEIKTLGNNNNNHAHKRIKFVENQLNFISKGPIGHSKLMFPNERTILEQLKIYDHEEHGNKSSLKLINSSILSCYNFNNFIKILRASKLSTKCKINKDLNGILSIQFLCKNNNLFNYVGTLITFNLLESTSLIQDDNVDIPKSKKNDSRNLLHNIFDDESYDFIKRYNDVNKHKQDQQMVSQAVIQEYEVLGGGFEVEQDDESDEQQPQRDIDRPPPLSYASFRNTSSSTNTTSASDSTSKPSNFQVNDTIHENSILEPTNNRPVSKPASRKKSSSKRKKQKEDDDDDEEIQTVGGAVEIPLFL